jgi:transcriptional regulator with XRE-family HTH domain
MPDAFASGYGYGGVRRLEVPVLLRRVIGDALRARRQGQHRTLREISTAANVSLGYLSEIERGQKEPSSELLAAICTALGSRLSDVLREASEHLARIETGALEAGSVDAGPLEPAGTATPPPMVSDGQVSVEIRRDGPLRTTLHAVRTHPRGVARTS